MNTRLQIAEVLEKLRELTGDGSTQKKIEWLRAHDSPTLRMLLQHNFDPNIQYNLPEGDPPYRPNEKPMGLTESSLMSESRKLSYLWLTPFDASLEQRVNAQAVEIAKQEQLLTEATRARDQHATVIQDLQTEYTSALQEHEAQLTILADLEERILLARKAVDASRVTMSQAKVRAQSAQQRVAAAQQQMHSVEQTLTRMRSIHANDKERLKKQPSFRPAIEPAPAPQNMPRHRLEMMFIQTLESIHPREAQVLLSVKNKTLTKTHAVTKDLVKKAFPDLLK